MYRSSQPNLSDFDDFEVDSYLISTGRFILFCDTLFHPEDMARIVHDLGQERVGRPFLVMNSHADWDHAWGNSYFTGEQTAPIIGHTHCRTRMTEEREKTMLASFQQRYPAQFSSVILMPPTATFQGTFTLYSGNLTVELFDAPGHSLDHIAAWIPELCLLLAFDAVEIPIPLNKKTLQACRACSLL
jgi:glyoxylase-like metal-dependent hydrolase (beta-lactamase superfamily II)